MTDLDATQNIFLTNLETALCGPRCSVFATSDAGSTPGGATVTYRETRAQPSGRATGGTTSPTGLPDTEPPYGGWDEVPERIPRAWQDQAADDAGVPRFGPI